MTDTHCHLTEPGLADRLDNVIADAGLVGVTEFVVPSVDVESSERAAVLAASRPGIAAAVGIHPLWADFPDATCLSRELDRIESLVSGHAGAVTAIGEIGLDDGPSWNDAAKMPDLAMRKRAFAAQLELARAANLPVIIHCRGRTGGLTSELVEILEHFGHNKSGGVLHAFSGSTETARRLRKLGYLRGVGGTVTIEAAVRLRSAVADCGPGDILLETDAPFIGNSIHGRGLSVPADLHAILRTTAMLMKLSADELERITDGSATEMFRRPAGRKQ